MLLFFQICVFYNTPCNKQNIRYKSESKVLICNNFDQVIFFPALLLFISYWRNQEEKIPFLFLTSLVNLWSHHHYRISKSSCNDDSDSALRVVDSCELLQGGKQNNCCLRTKEIIVCCFLTRWLSTPCTSNIHKGSFTRSMSHEKFYANYKTSSSSILNIRRSVGELVFEDELHSFEFE